MRNIVYNGDKALIDSGIFFGRGVFETILLKNGEAHFLKEHMERLNNGIKVLSLGEYIEQELVQRIIKENDLDNLALKVAVTERNVIFSTREIKYRKDDYLKGFKVRISSNIRNSRSKVTYIKSLNYLDNLLEYEDAKIRGFDEAVFFNENNMLAEGCTANIFIVKDNKIYTPLERCGLLPGVVRKYVMDNFDVTEKEITKEELLNADEAFMTNSLAGIMKVSNIDGVEFDGDLTETIRNKYEEFISSGGII